MEARYPDVDARNWTVLELMHKVATCPLMHNIQLLAYWRTGVIIGPCIVNIFQLEEDNWDKHARILATVPLERTHWCMHCGENANDHPR